MKRILKGPEPETLASFRATCPDATWEEMKNDACGGQEAYQDCRARTFADQHGLCAYCESKLKLDPGEISIEHIHPKSDTGSGHNWHLDWRNLVANCRGGETEGSQEMPLPDNLSCTASKDNALLAVNPLELPAFPNLFTFEKGNGTLLPNRAACEEAGVDAAVLEAALNTLNLNCLRLTRKRREVLIDIDRRKKIVRRKGYTPQQGMAEVARSFFQNKWPQFFTSYRCCLGQARKTTCNP